MSTHETDHQDHSESIAIIGTFCRFPGADNAGEFWRNLATGVESISFFSDEELLAAGVSPEMLAHPHYVKAQGVLEDIEGFDAAFFGLSPTEAEIIDPQHRIFLEGAWAALEDAGYDPDKYDGRVGVFAGSGLNSYLLHCLTTNPEAVRAKGDYLLLVSSDKDFMPTRASYKLNLKGPSIAVSTACSTSLVAVHLACQSLLSYQTDMALAGGAAIQVPHRVGYLYEEGGTQSPDGHCRAFDAKSGGLVGGSGAGIVVLKRLDDALADGDSIMAVIKGSAVNNDGSLKAGYTSPSVEGQAEVIAEAQAIAGVHPESIGYIEAHGTGTNLGDPIEIAALTQAFRGKTQKRQFCRIGSAKTNIGHLDVAAGIAGLIKTSLALKHRQIPPSLHFTAPNPEIDFAGSPFVVNASLVDWPQGNTPRRAGVSSFGIGGTNAHLILEEAPAASESRTSSRGAELLVLSAKSEAALEQASRNLSAFLRGHPDTALADAAFTLAQGRKAFDFRKSVVCRDASSAAEALDGADAVRVHGEAAVAFMFPGQGSQYLGMGAGLYRGEPVYRAALDRCAEILKPHLQCDIRDFLVDAGNAGETDISRTDLAQPLLFAVEYALAELWMSWGVRPDAMIGHSIGEYVAACLAGVFSLEDALFAVARRGALMQGMPAGEMLAVPLSEEEILPTLGEGVTLAGVNAPARCVVAGDAEALRRYRERLEQRGVECRTLHTSHAFHSPAMEGMLAEFTGVLEKLALKPPKIPFVSNLTGKRITDGEATDPAYWARHLRHCVRFADGLAVLRERPGRVLLEVGPGRTLCAFAALAGGKPLPAFPSLRHPQGKEADAEVVLQTLGRLWSAGAEVDWAAVQGPGRRRISLPTYPFERKRYWIAPRKTPAMAKEAAAAKADPQDWFYIPSWRRLPALSAADMKLQDGPVLLFMDDCGLGEQLLPRLEGRETVVVRKGQGFRRVAAKQYVLEPGGREGYESLVAELTEASLFPAVVVHLWTVGSETGSPAERAEAVLEKGFYSLVHLVQALESRRNPAAAGMAISVVTNNLFDVTGEESLSPEKATILGPVRVIPLEYPHIRCKGIEMLLPEGGQIPAGLAERVWAEIRCENGNGKNERVVALRGAHRWMQRFEAKRMAGESGNRSPRLREEGVCMIAGGLGGIGLELAKELAQHFRARLALVGPTQIPPRGEWERHLAAAAEEKKSDQLASLSGIDVERRETEIDAALGIRGIETYEGFARQADELCALYLYRYFRESGLDMSPGRRYTRVELREHLGILPKFWKFFNYFLKVLGEDKIVALEADSVAVLKSPQEMPEPDGLRKKMEAEYPAFKPMFAVFEHCMKHYRQALNGEIEAVGVLFPEGGGSLWEKSTKEIPEHTRHRVYTALARDIVLDAIARNPQRQLRILEIGAGAGIFTQVLLPVLKDQNVEYTFTDIGKSFVLDAERKAQADGYGFMKFGLLDISKDPGAQGYEPGTYDIVLELDAVHATRRMAETMNQVKKLLAPGGMLLFVESAVTQRWMNLPLGLLEGWWYFEDEDLRQDSPLLTLDTWENLLRQEGFRAIAYPADPVKRATADSGLIVAELPAEQSGAGKVAEKIRSLMELERLGAQTLPIAADIADREAMRNAIAQTEERFGPINCFLQTAAVENRGPIMTKAKNPERNEFLPKIHGTLLMDELLAGKNLDFILLSSSHSAFDVGLGDVEYCASNSFVDAYANMKARQGGTPVISVNWDRWRSVGMARAYEQMMQRRTGAAPVGGMSPEEGKEAFRRILAQDPLPAQVVVSICDFNEKIAGADLFSMGEASPASASAEAMHARPAMATSYVAPENDTQAEIARIWEEVLGIRQVGIRDSFYDLGGDSLIAVKVVSRLREALAVEMNVNTFFERPTVEALADRVEAMRWAQRTPPVAEAGDEEEEGTL